MYFGRACFGSLAVDSTCCASSPVALILFATTSMGQRNISKELESFLYSLSLSGFLCQLILNTISSLLEKARFCHVAQ